MKSKLYFSIAFRIIILFTVGAFMTFLPEMLRDFFGDIKYEPVKNEYLFYCDQGSGKIDTQWLWGARHYWYFWMMVCLFILSVINVVISIGKLIQKEYPNL